MLQYFPRDMRTRAIKEHREKNYMAALVRNPGLFMDSVKEKKKKKRDGDQDYHTEELETESLSH